MHDRVLIPSSRLSSVFRTMVTRFKTFHKSQTSWLALEAGNKLITRHKHLQQECCLRLHFAPSYSVWVCLLQRNNIVTVVIQTYSDCECEQSAVTAYCQRSLLLDAIVSIKLRKSVYLETSLMEYLSSRPWKFRLKTQMLRFTDFSYL